MMTAFDLLYNLLGKFYESVRLHNTHLKKALNIYVFKFKWAGKEFINKRYWKNLW